MKTSRNDSDPGAGVSKGAGLNAVRRDSLTAYSLVTRDGRRLVSYVEGGERVYPQLQ